MGIGCVMPNGAMLHSEGVYANGSMKRVHAMVNQAVADYSEPMSCLLAADLTGLR